jgi:glycosyltransferase involved in cell wall biosynthesis
MNVSVLIPFRNNESTIQKCLDSIPPDYEVLLWDDFSEDRTADIARSYQNCTVFSSPFKKSLGQMRGELFWLSEGDYVIYQDADDWRIPENTQTAVPLTRSVLMTPVVRTPSKLLRLQEDVLSDLFLMTFQTNGIIWERHVLERSAFPTIHCWEYFMVAEAYMHGFNFDYHSEPTAYYTGPGLYSANNRLGQLKSRLRLIQSLIKELKLTTAQHNYAVQTVKTTRKILADKFSHPCPLGRGSCISACFTSDDDRENGDRCLGSHCSE